MSLSLRAKLFLALLVASTLAVAATQIFVHWSFLHGLRVLAETRQQEQVEGIADRLLAIYSADGSWAPLEQDPRRWLGALYGSPSEPHQGRPGPGLGPGPGRGHGPGHRHMPPRWVQRALLETGEWPPAAALGATRGDHRAPRSTPLPLRLMLLDADQRPVFGREVLLAKASRFPLQLNGEAIGSLALLPGPTLADAAQHRFRQRQGGLLWVIALGIILLAALLAFPAAAALTRPVRALQQTARRLASGDYAARAPASARDELGRLAQDLNALAETLGRNEQARRRWVADIAHELRTPLALLQAEIEAMQDGIRRADPPALSVLLDDLLRLRRLVDDLNELTLTEPGTLAYQRQRVDLDSLVADVVDGFRTRCADKGLALRLQVDGAGPWQLEGDPDRLAQLLRNLLENSCRYTDPGHALQVRLERAAAALLLSIDDGPPAVDDDALPHLFDRLYRVDASRNRSSGGAGLGLAIARNIVEAHGGRIRAERSNLGGLRIRIHLPALEESDRTRGQEIEAPDSDR